MARSTKGLYKRSKTWWMTYADALGVQRFESCRTSCKEDAEKQLIKRRNEALEGIVSSPAMKPIGLHEFLDDYLKFVSTQRGVRTKRYHVQHLKRVLGNPPIHTLTVKLLEGYRQKRMEEKPGIGPATINREMATLKHAMTKAVSWKMVKKSIREDLRDVQKLQEPGGRLRYLTKEEAKVLVASCQGNFRAVVVTAIHTGMRKGELLGLTWDAVDLKHGFIRVRHSKNGQPRTIPMNETVKGTLTGLRTRLDVNWVFHDEEGKPYPNTRKRFEAACRRAGLIDFHFHDLRHTFASWLVMAGVPLPTVSDLLGHKSITMTMRYAHLSPAHRHEAIRSLDKNLTNSGLEGVREITVRQA